MEDCLPTSEWVYGSLCWMDGSTKDAPAHLLPNPSGRRSRSDSASPRRRLFFCQDFKLNLFPLTSNPGCCSSWERSSSGRCWSSVRARRSLSSSQPAPRWGSSRSSVSFSTIDLSRRFSLIFLASFVAPSIHAASQAQAAQEAAGNAGGGVENDMDQLAGDLGATGSQTGDKKPKKIRARECSFHLASFEAQTSSLSLLSSSVLLLQLERPSRIPSLTNGSSRTTFRLLKLLSSERPCTPATFRSVRRAMSRSASFSRSRCQSRPRNRSTDLRFSLLFSPSTPLHSESRFDLLSRM